MEHKVSLEGAVYFTKLSVRLACTWPPTRQASKRENTKEDVAWFLSFLSAICLLIPLLMSIYEYRSDSMILIQSVCFSCGTCNLIFKTLVCRIHRKKIQIVIHEMEEFVKNAPPHEIRVLQSYVDRCWIFHGVVTIMNYLANLVVVIGPIVFLRQPMPTFAVYPFSVDSGVTKYLVYIHQSVAGFQNSAGITIDCQLAIIMWFAGARFEILADEIKDISGIKELRSFVQKHQQLLSYTTLVSGTMCYVAVISTFVCGIATIMSSLQLVCNQPFIVKIQYGPVALIALINLWICAWPAENMIRVCDLIGTAVYNTSWTDMPPVLMKCINIILRRSQRPVLVTIGGFLPALSMRFYATFLSSAFSYFTTARLVVMSVTEN